LREVVEFVRWLIRALRILLRAVFGLVRGLFRTIKGAALVALSIAFVLRLLGSLIWLACSIPFAWRLAVWRFHRRLRRSGLDADAIDALTDEYEGGVRLFGPRVLRG